MISHIFDIRGHIFSCMATLTIVFTCSCQVPNLEDPDDIVPPYWFEFSRHPPLVCPGWSSIPASSPSENPPKNPDSPPHCQVTCSAPGGGKALCDKWTYCLWICRCPKECPFFLNGFDWDLLWQEVSKAEILRDQCWLNRSLLYIQYFNISYYNLSFPTIYRAMLCNIVPEH